MFGIHNVAVGGINRVFLKGNVWWVCQDKESGPNTEVAVLTR